MKLSNKPVDTRIFSRRDIKELPSYKLIEKLGLIYFEKSGIPVFGPFGKIIKTEIENFVRNNLLEEGFLEMEFPSIISNDLLKLSKRYKKFEKEIYMLKKDLILTPAVEEEVIKNFEKHLKSKKHLPFYIFTISKRFRDISSRRGVNRMKEFNMADIYGLHKNEKESLNSFKIFREVFKKIFKNLEINFVETTKDDENYTLFLNPSKEGEHTFYFCDNGHAVEGKNKRRYCKICNGRMKKEKGFGLGMFELCDKEIVESIMNNKKNKELSLTTYALGIERLIYGIIDKNRDDKGIKWPEKINFIKYSIIPTRTDSNKLNNFCEKMEKKLTNRKNLVLYDDRKRTNVSDKVAFSDQIGIRAKYIVGIDKKEKIYVQYEKRGSKIRTKINMEDFLG